MAVSTEEVRKIAYLARLGVDDDKLADYAQEINSVLSLVDQLNAIDTTNIEPMAHPLHASQRLRADEVTESDQRDVLQQGAPDVKNGLFVVPSLCIKRHSRTCLLCSQNVKSAAWSLQSCT